MKHSLWTWRIVLVMSLFIAKTMSTPHFEMGQLQARVEKGKGEISKLQQRASLPRGTCWKSALEDLELNCKGMIPELQSRLALRFTSCYNELFGFPLILCERSTPIAVCMQKLDQNTQSTFREFFLHTQDMCYFIEHQLWQEKTSDAVNDVTNAVFDVTKNLEESKETQEKVLQSQLESVKIQSNIIKDNSEIYTMVLNVKDVFEDVQASAIEQRQVVVEVFEKLSRMQKLVSWIQGEMSLLDMMGFYFAAILFGFFGTSSKRTQSGRFWVVLLLICTVGFERYLYNYLNVNENYSPETIQEYVWAVRRTAAALGVLLIVVSAAYYRDPQVVQQNVLTSVDARLVKMSIQLDNMHNLIRSNSMPMIEMDGPIEFELRQGDGEHLEDGSDSDTFSDYSNDSDVQESGTSPVFEKNSNSSDESNEENEIPETNSEDTDVILGTYLSPLPKDKSVDRSTGNVSMHSYNLRTRNTMSMSPGRPLEESVNQFAKYVKYPNRRATPSSANRRSAMYYSSDEDM